MFGYITINKDEMKIKDFKKYQSYYCGVCHSLKERYGFVGQVTLTYDMTFLAVLLSSLYEDQTPAQKHRCAPHPLKKHDAIYNEFTDYAAAMNILLTYYKLKDDWEDERSYKSNAMAMALKNAWKKATREFPDQAFEIERYIQNQREYEKNQSQDIDVVASATGEMLGNLMKKREDEWQNGLYRIGYFLGKYIYVMDAYDDLLEDIENNNYNPLKQYKDNPELEDICRNMLILLATECSKAFEVLPILDNADILRNILYSGIWSRFNRINQEKHSKKKLDK